ncbi:MAG: hypothetical protein RLY31_2671, partial [Bacteroidota bacterium]
IDFGKVIAVQKRCFFGNHYFRALLRCFLQRYGLFRFYRRLPDDSTADFFGLPRFAGRSAIASEGSADDSTDDFFGLPRLAGRSVPASDGSEDDSTADFFGLPRLAGRSAIASDGSADDSTDDFFGLPRLAGRSVIASCSVWSAAGISSISILPAVRMACTVADSDSGIRYMAVGGSGNSMMTVVVSS